MMNTEKPLMVEDGNSRQISINTPVLNEYVMGTFVTRDSNIYWEYTYNRFVYPLNVEHCAMHCIFDTESKCDFFFIVHSYCHLGNFNQPSGAYHYTDTVTTYINKGMV